MLTNKELEQELKKIGTELKQLRISKGYKSYEEFAWSNDLPRMQYWRMEKGTNFTYKSLYKVLKIHGLTVKEFFNRIN